MLENINSLNDYKKLSKDQLPPLACEIRERIIDVMKKNGGHLASNLGVVELVMAIHYVFESPSDRIIFDVGHQSYTHKILTGRNNQFDTIRKAGGLSGFTRRAESEHDPIDSGHASSSISQATGFAQAMALSGVNNRVLAIIGDGALTGGEAFEGLNYCGHAGLPVVIILNDNEMSIGNNVGAVSKYINKLAVTKFYQSITDDFEKTLKKTKNWLNCILNIINKLKKGFKLLFDYENIFTAFGFDYIGPIDGHNLEELIYIFEKVKKNVKHPVLLHVKTVKGKGFLQAEGDPSKFHGVTPDMMHNCKYEIKDNVTFTDIFGSKLTDMGKTHKDIVAITAAMETGTGLTQFHLNFPDRFYDVGIAEQHAVSFSAALSYSGYRPFIAIYSTFLMRAIDQICQDVCISKAPVIFMIDRGGIVGADGETHHGQFDISYLRMLPNITILVPCNAVELELMMEYAYSLKTPVAIRYPRGSVDINDRSFEKIDINDNHFVLKSSGDSILFIVVGPFVDDVVSVVDEFGSKGGVIYLRFAKPLPLEKLKTHILNYKKVVVVEESVYNGSVSQEIGSYISNMPCDIKFSSINIPDCFIPHGKRDEILNDIGFSKDAYRQIMKEIY